MKSPALKEHLKWKVKYCMFTVLTALLVKLVWLFFKKHPHLPTLARQTNSSAPTLMLLCCFPWILAWISCENYWVYKTAYICSMLYSYLIWSFSMWFICFIRCVFVAKPSLPCIFLPTSIRQGKLWDLIIVLCLLPFQSLPPWPCDRLKLCHRLVIILKNTAPDHTVLEVP